MYATNRKEYGEVVQMSSDWVTLPGPVPLVYEGWALDESEASPYDPAKAKLLMEEAGYPNGFKVDALEATLPPQYLQAAQVGQAQLKKELNIDVTLKTTSLAEWASRAYRGELAMTWYLEQQFSLPEMYVNRRFHTGSGANWTFYSNTKVDELIDQHYVQTDLKEAQRLLKEAQRIIVQEAPHVFLFSPVVHFTLRPHVHGYDPSVQATGAYWFYQLESIWMD
jgi:peptide/nickel transport system substrate-binding protein